MEFLRKNDTLDIVTLPDGMNPIGSKWVFKINTNEVGQVKKFKTRFVAKGYSQVEGVDFSEIFSLVAKSNSIRLVMYLVSTFDIEIEQIDMKKSFLHGNLEE